MGWGYRHPVTITNSVALRTDYSVLIIVTIPSSHIQSDLRDLRVTSSDGLTLLPFYIEHASTAAGKITVHLWVKLPLVPVATMTDALYLYSGNPEASAIASGRAAFLVYDGFEDYSIGALPPGAGYTSAAELVLSWASTTNVNVFDGPTKQGDRSLQIVDESTSTTVSATATSSTIAKERRGVVSVWLRRGADQAGSTDYFNLTLYGDGTDAAREKVVVGLGGQGKFHYWTVQPSPGFVDLDVSWSANTWYLVNVFFNANTEAFSFVVQDANMAVITTVDNLPMNNAANYVDAATLSTTDTYLDSSGAFADELLMRKFVSPEPTAVVGVEQTP